MVVGELEYKINEQKNEIKLLKKNNCKLQNYNNDLERQQEILFNLIYDILCNEIKCNEFQETYNKIEKIIISDNKDITSELLKFKKELNNNKLFRYVLLLLEYDFKFIPDKKETLILFS